MSIDVPLLDQAASDSPLYADVRLLERVLDDTIRACEGDQALARIESIRHAALRPHRQDAPSLVGEPARPGCWHG